LGFTVPPPARHVALLLALAALSGPLAIAQGATSDAGHDAALVREETAPLASAIAPATSADELPPTATATATPTPTATPTATATPTPIPTPTPTPSSSAAAHVEDASSEGLVKLHERTVFPVRVAQGTKTADQRAKAASQTLERLVEEKELADVRSEEQGDIVVVFGGKTPIIQLSSEDAVAAGDASLSVHAASVTAKVREALRTERQRKAIAESVFSFSLLVFSGLIAVLLLGKVRELADKTRAWIEKNPDRLPALRIQSIDLVRPAAVRGGLSVALGLGRLFGQLGIAYGWLLFASSLFESTRSYTERLTGFVLTPLSALIGRIGSALPLLVIALSAIIATVLLVRFVGLFFGSVGRGETALGWLPSDLAVPTGALVRFGIVVVALLVAAPLITGNDDGALARAGMAAIVALGFASSPVLASVAAGIPAVYGRRVRIGEYAEVGGRIGRVLSVSLLEVRLEDDMGCHLRVPHLMSLLHTTKVFGPYPEVTVDVVIDPLAPQGHVRSVLLAVAHRFGTVAKASLVRLDSEGAHYRVTARGHATTIDSDLPTGIADALGRENIALGRSQHRT
jgi:small-conductance mechanosensitive channel